MSIETALLIVPPREVQVFSFPIREQYDHEAFTKNIPAHLTLLYPFVPQEAVEEAIEILDRICQGFASFQLTLDRYGSFSDTIFMEPADPEPVIELYHFLVAAFPAYPAYLGEHGDELHPHMTLARFAQHQDAGRIDLPPPPSFTFTVDKLHLYLGSIDDDVAFIPRAIFPLGDASR